MDEIKRCSKCKMIYLKSNFYKDITKTMDIDHLVRSAVRSIIIIIKIDYLTIKKFIIKTIAIR